MRLKRIPQKLTGDTYRISLGDGHYALVDQDDYQRLKNFRWFWKKSCSRIYAVRKVVRNGRELLIRMHREILKTPRGQVCHHINRKTLDNRKRNLINLFPVEHSFAHRSGCL